MDQIHHRENYFFTRYLIHTLNNKELQLCSISAPITMLIGIYRGHILAFRTFLSSLWFICCEILGHNFLIIFLWKTSICDVVSRYIDRSCTKKVLPQSLSCVVWSGGRGAPVPVEGRQQRPRPKRKCGMVGMNSFALTLAVGAAKMMQSENDGRLSRPRNLDLNVICWEATVELQVVDWHDLTYLL